MPRTYIIISRHCQDVQSVGHQFCRLATFVYTFIIAHRGRDRQSNFLARLEMTRVRGMKTAANPGSSAPASTSALRLCPSYVYARHSPGFFLRLDRLTSYDYYLIDRTIN